MNAVAPWHFRKGRHSADKASELGISWEERVGGGRWHGGDNTEAGVDSVLTLTE